MKNREFRVRLVSASPLAGALSVGTWHDRPLAATNASLAGAGSGAGLSASAPWRPVGARRHPPRHDSARHRVQWTMASPFTHTIIARHPPCILLDDERSIRLLTMI
jgi:hypothetical protein